MKILGLDPGTHRLGWGIIDTHGSQTDLVAFGCLEPGKNLLPADRLVVLYQQLTDLMSLHQPDVVAVEELYFVQNVTTGLRVAEVRGVILLAIRQALLPVAEYKPNLIKATVTGYGHADKRQVQKMVQLLLHLDKPPKPDDAADGLAIALCHAIHARNSKLQIKL